MSHDTPQKPRFDATLKIAVMLAILLTPFAAAQAYVGPGAGLSLLNALWGLLCAIGAALLFVILWPIRRLRRKRREARQEAETQNPQAVTASRETTSSDHRQDRK